MPNKFRVGRKESRAILYVETGKEYLIFPKGEEQACIDYCAYLNKQSSKSLQTGFRKILIKTNYKSMFYSIRKELTKVESLNVLKRLEEKFNNNIDLIEDYEEVMIDKRRLVKELDVIINGKDAAEQASLIDIISQIRSERVGCKLYDIENDGLPDMGKLTGRVAFIFDGCIVSGWPLKGIKNYGPEDWEDNSDVGRHGVFSGIKKYIIFDKEIWNLF